MNISLSDFLNKLTLKSKGLMFFLTQFDRKKNRGGGLAKARPTLVYLSTFQNDNYCEDENNTYTCNDQEHSCV